MDRAQGRTSAYVVSAMGAISPARWQTTHESYRIGATSRVNVISSAAPLCAAAAAGIIAIASATIPAAKIAPEETDRRRVALPSLMGLALFRLFRFPSTDWRITATPLSARNPRSAVSERRWKRTGALHR